MRGCLWPAHNPPGWNFSNCNSRARSACRHRNSCAAFLSHRNLSSGWGKDVALSPARKAAFDILLTLDRGQAHSDDLLRGKGVSALSLQDRNLVTALVLGVVRWQLELDERLRPLLKRPYVKLD